MEPDYTRLLNASTQTHDHDLFTGLYQEMKKIAAGKMAMERPDHTLDATALVHEAWLRLGKSAPAEWRDRKQFYGAAAEAMRRILVDGARRRLAAKRGGGQEAVPLDDDLPIPAPLVDQRLFEIHEVLDELERENEMEAHIVKLRFFAGMNHGEIAALLEIGERSVERHLALAKLWLYRALND